jgi:ferredoxin-NADP reductase
MGADTPEISVPLATGRTDPRHDLAPTNPVQKAVQDNLEALQMSPQEKALQFHVKIREKKGTIESRYAANARGWLITAPSGATLFKCEPSDYEKDLDQKMLAGREHAIDNDAAHRDTYMKSSGQTFKPDQDEVSLGAAENSAKLPANEILPSEDVWPYNRIGQYNDAIRHGV